MGIIRSKPDWVSSKDIKVGKDYKYLADRRITNCRTLKRKVATSNKKKHDYNMMFDAGNDVRALFFVRTDKPIFKSCKRRRR